MRNSSASRDVDFPRVDLQTSTHVAIQDPGIIVDSKVAYSAVGGFVALVALYMVLQSGLVHKISIGKWFKAWLRPAQQHSKPKAAAKKKFQANVQRAKNKKKSGTGKK